jgi:hypothetical protein
MISEISMWGRIRSECNMKMEEKKDAEKIGREDE